MQKLHDFPQCLDHKEVALFLTKSESQQKALRLCHKCVVYQQKSLILIDYVKKQFVEIKFALLQQGESINLQNISILNDLKEQLSNLCKNINVLIDKINQNIDSQIQFIEQSSQQFHKMIGDIQFDQIELINKDKSQFIKQQVNFRELQQSLITQIGNLFSSLCKTKFEQLIQRMEVFEQNEIINQFFDFGLLTNLQKEKPLIGFVKNIKYRQLSLIYKHKRAFQVEWPVQNVFLNMLFNILIQIKCKNFGKVIMNKFWLFSIYIQVTLKKNNHKQFIN